MTTKNMVRCDKCSLCQKCDDIWKCIEADEDINEISDEDCPAEADY